MPTADRLQEEHDEDARLICAQAHTLDSHLTRLEALENWREGVQVRSEEQRARDEKRFRLFLTVASAALAAIGGLVVALILALVKK
jgi:hypothetical protein